MKPCPSIHRPLGKSAGVGSVQEPDWQTIFGHETPYDEQVDGIETAIELGQAGGYLALEGACGTGKTMIGLTAGITLVRDPTTDFERVLVLTSVKQQLAQFESDLQTINDGLPAANQVSGLTLVGKADLCPYVRGDGALTTKTVYDRCERLRDQTRGLTDRTDASELARNAVTMDHPLTVGGIPSPYQQSLPSHNETTFCPFYAQYLEDLPSDGSQGEAAPIEIDDQGLLDPTETIETALDNGICPHSMAGTLLSDVEVVIGNYYHAFDPLTIQALTGALLDETTYVVLDEAHMLEPRVRELLSERLATGTIQQAIGELTELYQARDPETTTPETDSDQVAAALADTAGTPADLKTVAAFLQALDTQIGEQVQTYLDTEGIEWDDPETRPAELTIPLREPDAPAPDTISEWATTVEDDAIWEQVEFACQTASTVFETITDTEADPDDRAVKTVGRVLNAWGQRDHEQFFRTIHLEERAGPTGTGQWDQVYRARLEIHNCVPSDAIGERLAQFGGGLLMSATLDPLSVFTTVTGLDHLTKSADRPVETRRYGLSFPDANRASFAVSAPKFTYANRGEPTAVDGLAEKGGDDVRAVYADLLRTAAQSPGNVLIGMPSYREAQWAKEVLASIEKPVLADTASDAARTQELKERFFDGEEKVLVTSLRGTLTEGVDYSGDRLSTAVVCGVPLVDTASPETQAMITAYDRAFGGDEAVGFEYALSIPAIRKARQALGRVIRGVDDVGVRILIDERYTTTGWDGVGEYIPEEFETVSPEWVAHALDQFWEGQ